MKIALGEKVDYYDICPVCGTKRSDENEKCVNCGKSLIRKVEKNANAPEEDEESSLYKVREQKSASETFKSLKGKSKVRYFMDYYLGKIVFGLIICALVGGLLYTTLKPRQNPVFYIATVATTLTDDSQERLKSDLGAMLITDEKHENIMIDTSYSSLVSDYNSMVGYTMHVSAGEIDMVILSKDELRWQVNNQAVVPVESVISKDILAKIDDSLKYKVTPAYTQQDGSAEYGEEQVYGLCIGSFLTKLVNIKNVEYSDKYVVAFIGNAPHKDKFDQVVKYMFNVK